MSSSGKLVVCTSRTNPCSISPHDLPYLLLLAVPLSLLLGVSIDQEPSVHQLAKRYGLDQFDPAVQQRVSKEMVDALLLQQATTAVAFDNIYITPFSLVSSSRPNCMSTSILSNVQRLATAPELTMMVQIAMALAHLHANDVVHGHVHPNIIHIKDDGQATLTHTGAYTAASRVLCSYTQSIPIQESFVYQAPEFVNIDAPCRPTKAMDVYAFGSTLYTVFAGAAPFDGRHRQLKTAIVEIGLHGHRRLPQPDGIGDSLWKIIRRCWEYDPATRPRMEHVVDGLITLHS